MRVHSAGTTINGVSMPFPYVRLPGRAAPSALEELRRQHPAATPVIVGGNDNSLQALFGEPPTLSPAELIERSAAADARSLQLAYERELHDRQMVRLRALDAPAALIRDWRPPTNIDVEAIVKQTWPEPPRLPIEPSCAAANDPVCIVLIPTLRSWEAAAYLHFGGWNACPAPWVHVAYAREWSARFGARLVALTHAALEFEIAHPITSRQDAAAMAAIHAYYCSDSPGLASMAEHAAYLLGARRWRFWWD